MTDTNRRIVTKYEYIGLKDFIKPDVKQMMDYLETLGQQGWTEIEFDPYDPDYVSLPQHRLENDVEYNNRIASETSEEKLRYEGRYRDYLKLKEEFGNE
jgi:hypothetical protein